MNSYRNSREIVTHFVNTGEQALNINEEAVARALSKDKAQQSIAIKILAVMGGMLASLSFTAFLFLTGIYDSGIALLAFGCLFIGAAITINKNAETIILDTLTISSFVIGLVIFGMGLQKLHLSLSEICIAVILISTFTISVVQNYILAFVAMLIINGSIITFLLTNKYFGQLQFYGMALIITTTYVFLNEAKLITLKAIGSLYPPLRIALLLSLISILTILGNTKNFSLPITHLWISSLVSIAAVLLLISRIMPLLNIHSQTQRWAVFIPSTVILSFTALSPAISGAMLLVLLTFSVNYKTGFVTSIVSLIYFISQFYYDLNLSLLTKAMLLFSSGILFLAFYFFTHKKLDENENI